MTHFFLSLAGDLKNKAVGVILSGAASDGTRGLVAIKAEGGLTFAQDKDTARYPSMPLSAVAAGCVDFCLPPAGIAAELSRINGHPYLRDVRAAESSHGPEIAEDGLRKICSMLRSAAGVDFQLYKHATISRRVARRMALRKLDTADQYVDLLRKDRTELNALYEEIFIHVTGFFRDAENLDALTRSLVARRRPANQSAPAIRVWVPGCSTGEEVYSIGMLLFEQLGDRRNGATIQIFGTDIADGAVDGARAGVYAESSLTDVSPERRKRFFVRVETGFQIARPLRDVCVFARHDLSRDPPFSKLDAISCRNVLIYMGDTLQKRLIDTFHYALKPDGFLLLGTSESLSAYSNLFSLEDSKHKIFVRRPYAGPLPLHAGLPDRPPPDKSGLESAPAAAMFDLRKETERILLDQYSPAAVVVDPQLQIIHFQGNTGPFLSPAVGEPSFHLLRMVRPELVVELRGAIHQVKREGVPVRREGIRFKQNGEPATVDLQVSPLKGRHSGRFDYLVVFHEGAAPAARHAKRQPGTPSATAERTKAALAGRERELTNLREQLRGMIEDHEATNEEMRSMHEELLSSYEELQSTNEELETAKEELESSNEELTTLNDEFQKRNAELSQLTNDLNNLLVGLDIPIVLLDSELRIRRFTPMAGAVLNLLGSDVGRPLTDIARTLPDVSWPELVSEVRGKSEPIQRDARNRDGHWYTLRMLPYRTDDRKIDSILIVLLDTDALKRSLEEAREARRLAEELARIELAIRESSSQAILSVEPDGRVVLVNPVAEKMFGYSRDEMLGQPVEMLLPESFRDASPLYRGGYFNEPDNRPATTNLELRGRRKDGTEFPIEATLTHIETKEGPRAISCITDLTEQKVSAEALRRSQEQLAFAGEALGIGVWEYDIRSGEMLGTIESWNLFGLPPGSAVSENDWLARVHPDDRTLVLEDFNRVLKGEKGGKIEYRVVWRDGTVHWLNRRAELLRDHEGKAVRIRGVSIDVTERKLAEQEIASRLASAQEIERRRIALELHDGLVQDLAALAIDLGRRVAEPAASSTVVKQDFRSLQGRVVKVAEVARHLAFELYPRELEDLGLEASLRSYCEEFGQREGIRIEFTSANLPDKPKLEIASCLYKIAQESLHNIAKHAKVKRARVTMDAGARRIRLRVEDEGVGFSASTLDSNPGLGILGMKERVQLVNGSITIHSQPGEGTLIAVEIPLPEEDG